jgi:hypothetical protein
MPKAETKAAVGMVRWWLSDGDEVCLHCGQLYVYEVELRCPECDRPYCPQCKRTREHQSVCPDCVQVSSAAEGSANG